MYTRMRDPCKIVVSDASSNLFRCGPVRDQVRFEAPRMWMGCKVTWGPTRGTTACAPSKWPQAEIEH